MSSLELRLRKIDETRNYFIDEIKHNDLISEKYKKICTYLNPVEHLVILASPVTCCVSHSTFASFVCVHVGLTSCAVRTKICLITAGIKRYNTIINKKKKKHDKIVLLKKYKLNTIEVQISKALIDSCISHHDFVSVY